MFLRGQSKTVSSHLVGYGIEGLQQSLLAIAIDTVKQSALNGGVFDAVHPYAGAFGGDAVYINRRK